VVGDDAPTFNGMRGGDEHLNLIGRSADISQIGELIYRPRLPLVPVS
jgi:hypothetical protein